MTRHQLRAARALLVIQQEVLALAAGVSVTSIRLFENGNRVGEGTVAKMRAALEAAGAVLVEAGAVVDGVEAFTGVVLGRWEDLPPETKARLEALDMTSEDAGKIAETKPKSVGRRARVPLAPGLRKPTRAEGTPKAPPKADPDATD